MARTCACVFHIQGVEMVVLFLLVSIHIVSLRNRGYSGFSIIKQVLDTCSFPQRAAFCSTEHSGLTKENNQSSLLNIYFHDNTSLRIVEQLIGSTLHEKDTVREPESTTKSFSSL